MGIVIDRAHWGRQVKPTTEEGLATCLIAKLFIIVRSFAVSTYEKGTTYFRKLPYKPGD